MMSVSYFQSHVKTIMNKKPATKIDLLAGGQSSDLGDGHSLINKGSCAFKP